jgi:hypothetical protein
MSIPIEFFVNPEKLLEYVRLNSDSFQPCGSDNLSESNYYMLEKDNSRFVVLMHKINASYYVFSPVLYKTAGDTQFYKIQEQTKTTHSKSFFCSTYHTIKLIGSVDLIKNYHISWQMLYESRHGGSYAGSNSGSYAGSNSGSHGGSNSGSHGGSNSGTHGGTHGGSYAGHQVDYARQQQFLTTSTSNLPYLTTTRVDMNSLHPHEGPNLSVLGQARQQTLPSIVSASATATATASVFRRAPQIKTEEVKDGQDYAENITCKICMTNKVNMVYIPCGHCFCSDCDRRKPGNNCAICRTPIQSTQTFFI